MHKWLRYSICYAFWIIEIMFASAGLMTVVLGRYSIGAAMMTIAIYLHVWQAEERKTVTTLIARARYAKKCEKEIDEWLKNGKPVNSDCETSCCGDHSCCAEDMSPAPATPPETNTEEKK